MRRRPVFNIYWVPKTDTVPRWGPGTEVARIQDPERCPLTRHLRRGRKPVLMGLCARQLARDFNVISFNLIKTHQSRVLGVWFGVGILVCLCARRLRLRAVKELA